MQPATYPVNIAETLRLRVAMFVTRTPDEQSYDLGPWKCPPKMDMVLSSRTSALNPNIWNAGTTEDPPHPLDTFWADRFLIYPDDPTSGPLKKEIFPNKDSRQEVVTMRKIKSQPQLSRWKVSPGLGSRSEGGRGCVRAVTSRNKN
jgi:hypothetical protein